MATETTLKATVTQPGDHSVGIFDQVFELDLGLPLDDLKTTPDAEPFLSAVRGRLSSLYEYVLGESVSVTFNAECPDCGRLWGEHHKDCPNHEDAKHGV